MRADAIAALGNPVIKTPNLDRLAHRGLAFTRAYMQSACNGATCVPSRAMQLSGQDVFHGDEKLNRDSTWPEAFAKDGYRTFISGKWHNGDSLLNRSFQQAGWWRANIPPASTSAHSSPMKPSGCSRTTAR